MLPGRIKLESDENLQYSLPINNPGGGGRATIQEELCDVTLSRSFEAENIHPRSASVSSRLLSSFQRVRSFTQYSIHQGQPEVQDDDRKNSAFVAGWNVTNLIQGIGILGLPYAIKMGSWPAIGLTALFAVVCCFTGELIIDAMYTTCPMTGKRERRYMSYSCLGEAVWPRFGRQMVTVIGLVEMLGGTILYIILLATMSSTLMHQVAPGLNIYHWSLITTYATIPLLFVTRLSVISWFSLIGVLGLLSTIGTIIAFCLTRIADMTLTNMPAFSPTSFPVSLGIIVFSYCAHAVLPGIEGSMKKPERYPAMLRCAFTVAALLKVFMGLTAVLIFGDQTEQEFTANMRDTYGFNFAICVLVFINVFFSVPLAAYVITERIDALLLPYFHPILQPHARLNWYWVLITRLTLLTFALLIAMLVPHFALLMGVVGSFTGTCLSFIFPCWFHLVLKAEQLSRLGVAIRVLVILVCTIVGILGVIFSVREIRAAFAS